MRRFLFTFKTILRDTRKMYRVRIVYIQRYVVWYPVCWRIFASMFHVEKFLTNLKLILVLTKEFIGHYVFSLISLDIHY